jgi:hypothetical protein
MRSAQKLRKLPGHGKTAATRFGFVGTHKLFNLGGKSPEKWCIDSPTVIPQMLDASITSTGPIFFSRVYHGRQQYTERHFPTEAPAWTESSQSAPGSSVTQPSLILQLTDSLFKTREWKLQTSGSTQYLRISDRPRCRRTKGSNTV